MNSSSSNNKRRSSAIRLLPKKSKPPRIISRRSAGAGGQQFDPEDLLLDLESSSPTKLLLEEEGIADENNVFVHSGQAYYCKRNYPEEESVTADKITTLRNGQSVAAVRAGNGEKSIVLPGMSDTVESYPCPICTDERVFMTRAGLAKHAEQHHSEHKEEIAELAELIQQEWERRRNAGQQMAGSSSTSSYQRHHSHYFQEVPVDEGSTSSVLTGPHLACNFCRLVFRHGAELSEHIEINHSGVRFKQPQSYRERRFYCHLCWEVCFDIGQLNTHKQQVHGIVVDNISSQSSGGAIPHNFNELPARTQCPLCGLTLVRPSLLLRHLLRAHNCRAGGITAKVTYPHATTLPPINYRVDPDGNLIWKCCEQNFMNKEDLLAHRLQAHFVLPTPQAQKETEILRQVFPTRTTITQQKHQQPIFLAPMEEEETGDDFFTAAGVGGSGGIGHGRSSLMSNTYYDDDNAEGIMITDDFLDRNWMGREGAGEEEDITIVGHNEDNLLN